MHFKWVLIELWGYTLCFTMKIPKKWDEQRILITFSLEEKKVSSLLIYKPFVKVMQNFHSVGEEQSCTGFPYSSDTANLLAERFISQNFHLANGKEGSKMRFSPFLYYLNQTLSINLEHTTWWSTPHEGKKCLMNMSVHFHCGAKVEESAGGPPACLDSWGWEREPVGRPSTGLPAVGGCPALLERRALHKESSPSLCPSLINPPHYPNEESCVPLLQALLLYRKGK